MCVSTFLKHRVCHVLPTVFLKNSSVLRSPLLWQPGFSSRLLQLLRRPRAPRARNQPAQARGLRQHTCVSLCGSEAALRSPWGHTCTRPSQGHGAGLSTLVCWPPAPGTSPASGLFASGFSSLARGKPGHPERRVPRCAQDPSQLSARGSWIRRGGLLIRPMQTQDELSADTLFLPLQLGPRQLRMRHRPQNTRGVLQLSSSPWQ